jgi:DNA-binding HxlR family transcriptional regulator
MKKIKSRSACPISSALDIFGDKWSLLIIRDLMFKGKNTYGAFAQSGEKIATNILADRLSLLECAGIITKKQHPESKAKYFYQLTSKGLALMPVLMEIIVWSDTYGDFPDQVKKFARKVKRNRAALIKHILATLK